MIPFGVVGTAADDPGMQFHFFHDAPQSGRKEFLVIAERYDVRFQLSEDGVRVGAASQERPIDKRQSLDCTTPPLFGCCGFPFFQPSDGSVAGNDNHQSIAKLPCLAKVREVAGMETIKRAKGKDGFHSKGKV